MSAYKKGDEFNTQCQLKRRSPSVDGKNWLRHEEGMGTAAIDGMLLDGTTMAQMSTARGAVEEHLYHLEHEHGLTILEQDGQYVFAPKQPKKSR